MNEDYAPDAEFVERLEWELKSAMRRQGYLNGTSSTARRAASRLAATLVLAVVSMSVGGAGTYAAIYTVDERAAALHIARGEALLEIARTQLEPAARELAKTQALVQQGAATERELQQVEAVFLQAQSEVKTRELELAETHLTGRGANDALSAPLVNGTDFVTARLVERRRPMQQRFEVMTADWRRSQDLVNAGVASAGESKAAQMQVAGAGQELAGLEERITLRASFLAGKLSATEVELKGMRLAAMAGKEMAARQVEVLAEQHKRLTLLSERGMVSDSELRNIEAQLRAVEAQAELAGLELRILDQKLKDAAAQ